MSIDDLTDTNGCNTNIMRQAVLGQAEWFHEILEEDLAGMDGGECFVHGYLPLRMIINDLDISGLVVDPLETDAPLVVDANTVLSSTFSFQFLKPVTWRSKQVVEIFSVIEIDHFAASGALNRSSATVSMGE